MAHPSTVLAQMLKLLLRHEFDALARERHEGRKLRKISRWAQFVAMASAQLTGRASLRDLLGNLAAQSSKLYHLGLGLISRSSLARTNEKQPWNLYEALFFKLLGRCQQRAPGHGFRFKNKLFSLDASTIDVCLSMFPWAKFRQAKGAIKLHVGLDHPGMLPTFVSITDGKTHDVTADRIVLQVDQAEPQDQDVSRHLEECRHDPDLDRNVRLSSAGVSEVHQSINPQPATNSPLASAQSFRA